MGITSYTSLRPKTQLRLVVLAPPPPVPKPPPQPRSLQQQAPDTTNEEHPSDEEEIATVKRVPAVTLQLWESLLKPRGFEITGGSLVRSPSKSQGGSAVEVQVSPLGAKKSLKGKERERDADINGSVISSFKRVNSFVPPPVATSVPRQPFRRVASVLEPRSTPKDNATDAAGPSMPDTSRRLFSGLKFRGLGEARSAVVRTEIEGCGGQMVSDEEGDEDVDFVIVRLVRYVWYLIFHSLHCETEYFCSAVVNSIEMSPMNRNAQSIELNAGSNGVCSKSGYAYLMSTSPSPH